MSFSTKIDDIAKEPPLVAKPMMRIGELLGKMRELRLWLVPVVEDKDRLIGVVSYRTILMRGAGRDTKVLTVMEPPYAIKSGTRFDEALAKFVSWKARAVPIVDDKRRLLAMVTRADVLEYMLR
ncbi:MAG TPA: CBS domain-containing protein, partial [Ignisphaera aggregans]|nr:CBS domain-containing protein [Ignisphaera aggregans]